MTPVPRHARIPSLIYPLLLYLPPLCAWQISQYRRCPVILLRPPTCKPGNCLCHLPKNFLWRICRNDSHTSCTLSMPKNSPAQFCDSSNPSLEKIAESPRSSRTVSFIIGFPKHSRWNATKLQLPAAARGRNQQAFHSRAGDSQNPDSRVEARILHRDVARRRHSSQHHSPVDCAQHGRRRRPRFMPAAQCSHRQRRILCRWQPFPGNVVQIDFNHAICQRKKIQKVAAHFVKRLEFMAGGGVHSSHRSLRKHSHLNRG